MRPKWLKKVASDTHKFPYRQAHSSSPRVATLQPFYNPTPSFSLQYYKNCKFSPISPYLCTIKSGSTHTGEISSRDIEDEELMKRLKRTEMRELMKRQIAAVRAQTHEATHQVKLTAVIRDRKNEKPP